MKKLLVLITMLLLSSNTMAMEKKDKVLDLRIVDMGYRWVQNKDNSAKSHSRVFMTFGITKKDFVRFGWDRKGISTPFDSADGSDCLIFQYTHRFESM